MYSMHLLWPQALSSRHSTEPAPITKLEDFEPLLNFVGVTFVPIVLLLRLLFAKFHFVRPVLTAYLGIHRHLLGKRR